MPSNKRYVPFSISFHVYFTANSLLFSFDPSRKAPHFLELWPCDVLCSLHLAKQIKGWRDQIDFPLLFSAQPISYSHVIWRANGKWEGKTTNAAGVSQQAQFRRILCAVSINFCFPPRLIAIIFLFFSLSLSSFLNAGDLSEPEMTLDSQPDGRGSETK